MMPPRTSPQLVMNIERKWFAEIVAKPPRKTVEYRNLSDYWLRRLANVGKAPFELRLLNGMRPPVPEAIVQVTKVVKNPGAGEIKFHLGEVLRVKNWDRRTQRPIRAQR
jgi:hypothetical protein